MYYSICERSAEHYEQEFEDSMREKRLVLSGDGNILFLNKYAEEYFHMGANFFDYFNYSESKKAVNFLKRLFIDRERTSMSLNHTFSQSSISMTYQGVYKDGKFFLVGYSSTTSAMEDMDSTADSLIHTLDNPIILINSDFSVAHYNDSFCRFIDADPADIREENLLSLQHKWKRMSFIHQFVKELFFTRSSSEKEWELDGPYECVKLKGMFVPKRCQVLVSVYDLSYEKKYHHLLTYQGQMESVSHLSASVAHELRNPLSVIKGFLQLSSLTESFHKYSDTILSEVDRMNEIIDNFLSMARKRVQKEQKKPAELLEGIVDIIQSECLLQGISFQYDVDRGNRTIEANEATFKQIILNVLRNAVEAFPKDRKNNLFRIHGFETTEGYCVELTDNGNGIPESILEKIGKPFFTTKEKGTGVGIPLCKKIMEDHGGTFHIDSKENQGTTIQLNFPFVQQDHSESVTNPSSEQYS